MLRSLGFNLAFWLWTVALAILGLPWLLLPRTTMLAVPRLWTRGVQVLLRTLVELDHEIRGRERIPAGDVILAFKHQSAWDTLILHVVLQDPAIALKRELTWIPVFGWYLSVAGMVPIDRAEGAKALRSLVKDARAALARGQQIVIFPEGTRVPPGARRPYLPGVAALYSQLGVPVVPVALNSGLYWARRSFIKRPGRVLLEFLPAIPPGLDRRRFMALLEERLEDGTNRLIAEARPAPQIA